MYSRPDEKTYEATRQREENFDSRIGQGLNLVKNVGLTAAGVGLSSKIMPFLSQYITPEIALKGISKISPQLGNFLKKGQSMGLDIQSGLDYLRNNVEKDKPKEQQQAKEERNIIEQYAPELDQFIKQQIASGKTPIQAGALAYNDSKFKSVISKLINDHKTPFAKIVESVYGQSISNEMQAPQASNQPTQAGSDRWGEIVNTMKQLLES